MPEAHILASSNAVGAMAIVLGDRMRAAAEEAAGDAGAIPAALTSLYGWAEGRPIDVLSGGLRVSHSRTVRVVDRLEERGLVARRASPDDARVVLVDLTVAGRRVARRVLAARARALEECLAGLDDEARAQLGALAGLVLERATTGRLSARGICRLCDVHACGHDDGRCPVTRAADAAEAAVVHADGVT